MRRLIGALIVAVALTATDNAPVRAQKSCLFQEPALRSRVVAHSEALEDALTRQNYQDACRIAAHMAAAQEKLIRYMETYQVGCVIDSNDIDRARLRHKTMSTLAKTLAAKECMNAR